jgi:hypothetical protein
MNLPNINVFNTVNSKSEFEFVTYRKLTIPTPCIHHYSFQIKNDVVYRLQHSLFLSIDSDVINIV